MTETRLSANASSADNLPGIEFPVLVLSLGERHVLVEETYEAVTTATAHALKKGWYDGLLIAGSNSLALRVKRATKLHRVGRFSIFLNPLIRVALEFDGAPFAVSTDDVRRHVLDVFNADEELWDSGGQLDSLRSGVEKAASVREIIRVLRRRGGYSPPYPEE